MSTYNYFYGNDPNSELHFDSNISNNFGDCSSVFGARAQAVNIAQRMSAFFKSRAILGDQFVRCFSGYDALVQDQTGDLFSTVTLNNGDPGFDAAYQAIDDLWHFINDNYTANNQKFVLTNKFGQTVSLTTTETVNPLRTVHTINYHVGLDWQKFASTTKGLNGPEKVDCNNFIQDITGTYWIDFSDIVADQVDNEMVNEAISNCLDYAIQHPDANSVADVLSVFDVTARNSIGEFVNSIRSAFSMAGLVGLLNYVSSLVNTVRTVTWDGNEASLKVTDNASLMPAVYMAGLLGALNDEASNLASIIAGILAPPVGLLVWLVSNLGKLISLPFRYQYETATLASINDYGDMVSYPMAEGRKYFPQNIFSIGTPENNELYYYGINNVNFCVKLPFCEAWCSSAQNADGQGHKAVIEYHIDSINRVDEVLYFFQYTVLSKTPTAGYDYAFAINPNLVNPLDNIKTVLNSRTDRKVANGENGVLSESDDQYARLVYWCNLCMYMLTATFIEEHTNYSLTIEFDETASTVENYLLNGARFSNIGGSQDIPFLELSCAQRFGINICKLAMYARDRSRTDLIPSWAQLISGAESVVNKTGTIHDNNLQFLGKVGYDEGQWSLFREESMTSYHYPLSGRGLPIINLPKYDRGTFFNALATLATVAAVMTAEFCFFKFAAKTVLSKWAIRRAVDVENAWTDVVNDPSDTNIKKYRSLALKNNILSKMFGGSKYLRTGFWGATSLPEARLASISKAFLTGGAGGVIAAKILGTDDDYTKRVISHMNTLIIGN